MTSKNFAVIPSCIILLMLFGFVSSDINQDKAECTDQLLGLATCLPYVGGDAKAPTIECCEGAKQVVQKSMKCLCVLIKDRNDPSLGLKFNTTLALNLPSTCHVTANVTKCIELLHLPQSSADAKIFQDFARSLEHLNKTSPAANEGGKGNSGGSSADIKNDGGRGEGLFKFEISAVLLWLFTAYHLY